MGLFAEHSAQRVRSSPSCLVADLLASLDDADREALGRRMATDPRVDPSTWIAEDLQAAGFVVTLARKQLALHLTRHRKGQCPCG